MTRTRHNVWLMVKKENVKIDDATDAQSMERSQRRWEELRRTKLLLEHGVDATSWDKQTRSTPLHQASQGRYGRCRYIPPG